METTDISIHKFIFVIIITLLLFQSILLFIRSKNNKVRRTMAYLELLWASVYTLAFVLLNFVFSSLEYTLLREKVLIVGNLFITFTHFFPMQVLLPGWLNWKRGFLLTLPILVLTVIYYGGMALLGEKAESLTSYTMLWNSLGHFNVWFRFVMLLSNILYIVVILIWLYGYEKRYIQWKNDNFADQEYVDISWMRSYDVLIIGIFFFYLGILFIGGHLSVVCHGIYFISTFSYLFYKSLFYESPYPEDFFAQKSPASLPVKIMVPQAPSASVQPTDTEVVTLNEQTFSTKIVSYKEQLQQWMETEKPYLFHDFKLTDVSHVLPLNRTYLSRVFNEGFGQNFSEVVRAYRINYSKEILKKNSSIPMYKVAELCGFRSDSTYIKAFKQVTGMTPNQYRSKVEEEEAEKQKAQSPEE